MWAGSAHASRAARARGAAGLVSSSIAQEWLGWPWGRVGMERDRQPAAVLHNAAQRTYLSPGPPLGGATAAARVAAAARRAAPPCRPGQGGGSRRAAACLRAALAQSCAACAHTPRGAGSPGGRPLPRTCKQRQSAACSAAAPPPTPCPARWRGRRHSTLRRRLGVDRATTAGRQDVHGRSAACIGVAYTCNYRVAAEPYAEAEARRQQQACMTTWCSGDVLQWEGGLCGVHMGAPCHLPASRPGSGPRTLCEQHGRPIGCIQLSCK